MNEKDFQKQLDIIGQEETPEDMNIWEAIKMELVEEKQKKQKRPPSRFPWLKQVAALAVLLIGLGIAGFIYYRQSPQLAPFISEPSLPESLVSHLRLSQTIEGVTVTIDWAYADAERIAIGMTTSYMSDVAFDPYCMTCNVSFSLHTADGQEVPPAFGGGGGGGGGGDMSEPYLISTSTSASYDASDLQITGDSITLVMTLDYEPQAGQAGTVGSNGGGGGGGGGGSADSSDAPIPTPTLDPAEMPSRNYRFEFTIPFYATKSATVETPVVEANGINFEISNVRVSPSLLRFELCYNLPSNFPWYPNAMVYTGSEYSLYANESLTPYVDLQGRTVYPAYSNDEGTNINMLADSIFDFEAQRACGSFVAQAPYEGGDIEIIIPDIYTWPSPIIGTPMQEERLAEQQAYFASIGIEFEYTSTNDENQARDVREGSFVYPSDANDVIWYIITITKHPEGMTLNEAMQYLLSHWMLEHVQTDVTFVVKVDN